MDQSGWNMTYRYFHVAEVGTRGDLGKAMSKCAAAIGAET
jgi:hypothetical protein